MDLQYFPHFIRKNFPYSQISKKDMIKIGEDFKIYLLETFKGKEDLLEKIWDISPLSILRNSFNMDIFNPKTINGFNPMLLHHFNKFFEKTVKEDEKRY
jgi:hypothetical protein